MCVVFNSDERGRDHLLDLVIVRNKTIHLNKKPKESKRKSIPTHLADPKLRLAIRKCNLH